MSLRARIARAQQRMLDARAERDALIRRRVVDEGATMYRVAKEMREDIGEGALSDSMIREIVKDRGAALVKKRRASGEKP